MINWEKYRAMYQAVGEQTYFMTAGAGAISNRALEAVTTRYQQIAQQGGRLFADNLKIMETCREKIAQLINADKEHIAFIPSVSFGMNALAHSLPKQGNVVLMQNDFASTNLPWVHAKHPIQWLPSAAHLQDFLHEKHDNATIVTSFVHYANGYKLDLNKLKPITGEQLVIINATQGVGAFPIDVLAQGIDALVCSCYKWMGCGEGLAFLYINPTLFDRLTPALIGWRSVQSALNFDGQNQYYQDARIFELGWDNMTIFSGLDAQLDLISEIGIENIADRILNLTAYLTKKLQEKSIPTRSNFDRINQSGIVLIGPFDNPNAVMKQLEEHNIWVTVRDEGIRVSLHYYNNEADIDRLINVLGDL